MSRLARVVKNSRILIKQDIKSIEMYIITKKW